MKKQMLLPKSSLITLDKISFCPNNKKIIYDISVSLKEGEITTIIGPNGAGKTTLIKIILGFLSPTQGQIHKNKDFKIGYVPQKIGFNRFLPLRVLDFLKLCADEQTIEASLKDIQHLQVDALLTTELALLSGGELQKVLLLQALLKNPSLLILDEPTQGLDISGQALLYEAIYEIHAKRQCCVLFVSHDLHVVMAKSQNILCLNRHICCQGAPETIKNHPEYLALFGHTLSKHLGVYHHTHDHTHD